MHSHLVRLPQLLHVELKRYELDSNRIMEWKLFDRFAIPRRLVVESPSRVIASNSQLSRKKLHTMANDQKSYFSYLPNELKKEVEKSCVFLFLFHLPLPILLFFLSFASSFLRTISILLSLRLSIAILAISTIFTASLFIEV